jgi:hypothetical protein
MAHFNNGGASPFRHKLLSGIGNHFVIADLEIPTGFQPPSRLCDRAPKGVDAPGTWESAMNAAVFVATSPAKEAANLTLSRNS